MRFLKLFLGKRPPYRHNTTSPHSELNTKSEPVTKMTISLVYRPLEPFPCTPQALIATSSARRPITDPRARNNSLPEHAANYNRVLIHSIHQRVLQQSQAYEVTNGLIDVVGHHRDTAFYCGGSRQLAMSALKA
jgi:hypothetical protein